MAQGREAEREPEVVFEVNRANGDVLRATFSTYKGKAYAGVRVFYRDDAGELRPGRNGCTLGVDEVPGLAAAVLVLLRDTSDDATMIGYANELLWRLPGGGA